MRRILALAGSFKRWTGDAGSHSRPLGRSMGRNLSVMMVAQLFTWVSSFVLLLYLPRYLGSVEYGRLFVALSIREILSIVIDYGGSHLIPKVVAREPHRRRQVVRTYALVRAAIWAGCSVTLALAAWWLQASEWMVRLVAVLLVANLAESLSRTLRSYFQGLENLERPAAAQIAERVTVAAFAVGVLLLGGGSLQVAMVMAAGTVLHLAVLMGISWPLLRSQGILGAPRPGETEPPEAGTPDADLPKAGTPANGSLENAPPKRPPAPSTPSETSLASGMPYFLWSVFSILYFRVDALMLGSMAEERVTGWYGGAYRFFDAVMVVPALYRLAVYPVLARLMSDPQASGGLGSTLERSLRLIVVLSVPLAVTVWFLAPEIIGFFMGIGEYAPSVPILRIFALAIPLMFADFILTSALLAAADRQRAWAAVGLAAVALNVALNLALIPYTQQHMGNGGLGAAVATLATELFILGSAIRLMPAGWLSAFTGDRLTGLAGLVALMTGAFFAFQFFDLPVLLQVTAAGTLFLAALRPLGLLQPEEWAALRRSVRPFTQPPSP